MKYALALALTLLVAVGAWGGYNATRYNATRYEIKQLAAVLKATGDSLEVARRIEAKTDTVWRVKVRPVWDSVRVTDTVRIDSVIYVPRDAADSAVNACSLALDACQHAGIKRDSVIAQQDRMIDLLEKKPGPCRFLGIRCELVTGVLGLTAGVLIAK